MTRRGLVLSGGAALGAYQAGVLRALHEADLEFQVISATSIGTINGLAWNIPEVIAELDQHWIDNVARHKPFDLGRLKQAANPFQFHTTLDRITEDYRHRYPFDRQRSEVLLTLTHFNSNHTAVFSSTDTVLSETEKALAMKAATAIPHIGSTPVEIQGERYFDGAYHDKLPITPLQAYTLDELWLIPLSRTRPADAVEPFGGWLNWSLDKVGNPYLHSLLGVLTQLRYPPRLPSAEKWCCVISPYDGAARNHMRPGGSMLFSLSNIKKLLAHGFQDGNRALERYSRSSSKREI